MVKTLAVWSSFVISKHWDIFSEEGSSVTHVKVAHSASCRTALPVTQLADEVKLGRICHYSTFYKGDVLTAAC